ncbi:MAG: hypothetical protein ACREBU_12605 [Nitrososphaera sp.]
MDPGLRQNSNRTFQGRFMYADYSPLEDDRNLVEIIKDFASLVSRLGKMEIKNRKLASLLSDSESLRADIVTAIKNIKMNTQDTMERFYDAHSDVLASDLLTTGGAILLDTKNSLSELLGNTEVNFDQRHAKYKEKISSEIEENNISATNLIQSWLASDHRNLPRPIVENLVVTISASLNRKNLQSYAISRMTSSSTATSATIQSSRDREGIVEQPGTEALQFSYTFDIDASDLEFWNHRRTVVDLGIKELMLPVGMKAPVSERIRRTFRFGSRKDAEVLKEPDFLRVDNYNLHSASLNGDKTLVIELTEDIKKSKSDLFRITFDVGTLSDSRYTGHQADNSAAARPRIDLISMTDDGTISTSSDLLQVGEIEKNSDISKIRLVGAAVLSRIRGLEAPEIVRSRGRLEELRIREDSVIPSAILKNNYEPAFEFLESVASSYAPFVRKMKEKTLVQGELSLREEVGGGQRKEYSVRVEELKSLLNEARHGNRISTAIGLGDIT